MGQKNTYQRPRISSRAELNYLMDIHAQGGGANTDYAMTLEDAAKYAGFEIEYVHTITSAELLALNGTPQEVVPAPGAGWALIPTLWGAYKAAGTAYAGIATGEDLALKYTNGSGIEVATQIETTGFLDQTTAETRFAAGIGGLTASIEPVANAALVAQLLVGEITTGDSDLVVLVRTKIVPTVIAE